MISRPHLTRVYPISSHSLIPISHLSSLLFVDVVFVVGGFLGFCFLVFLMTEFGGKKVGWRGFVCGVVIVVVVKEKNKRGKSAERLSTDGEVGGGLVWLSGLDGDVVGLHVVEADEDEGSAETTEDVGTGTLEEGVDTVVLEDLGSAVEGSRVLGLGGTRGHHHAATDGVEGVGDETSDDGDGVTEGEAGEETGILAHEVHLVGGIVDAKVSTTVEDDTDAGDDEAVVDSTLTPSLSTGGLEDAVKGSGELALGSVSDIDGETGTGKVEGVDDEERGGSGGTTRGDVGEEADEETIRAGATEPLSVEVLEHKVEGLGGEVADDVSHVSTPERNPSLLLGHTTEAVDDTSVGLGDLGRLSLVLEEELDALDGGSDGLGNTGGDTSEHKVFEHVGGRHLGQPFLCVLLCPGRCVLERGRERSTEKTQKGFAFRPECHWSAMCTMPLVKILTDYLSPPITILSRSS